ncbi:hypothetical protein DRO97_02485 [Archaeoglobales archaeon]|nr:MAG: hypothetical protein DRO97_02485 [Archaeoglobales archaeon]
MICIICGKNVQKDTFLKHLESHFYLNKDEIVGYFQELCHPFNVKLHKATCVDVKNRTIFFSVENAALFIAFAKERFGIDWKKCCEWMALHEKYHIELREFYEPPNVNYNIISNVEDYYIEKNMMPEEYKDVCIANARLVVELRRIMPFSRKSLVDKDINAYYYMTLAAWHALGIDFNLKLKSFEWAFIKNVSNLMKEIKDFKDLPKVMLKISSLHDFFFELITKIF